MNSIHCYLKAPCIIPCDAQWGESLYELFLGFKELLPYASHYKPRLVYVLPHFSLQFIL